MMYSMTGYGRKECKLGEYQCIVELRSLNGKQFELNTKIPNLLRAFELPIRQTIQQQLQRGSIDLNIQLKLFGSSKPQQLNTELIRIYFEQLSRLSDEWSLDKSQILPALLRIPDVVSSPNEVPDEQFWPILEHCVEQACAALNGHREQEGQMLETEITHNIESIQSLEQLLDELETARQQRLRLKLTQAVQEWTENKNFDANRLEQELILYMERLDISEERSRLKHHCSYFYELMEDKDLLKGKKIGFLLQEIGREINTLGSKANDAAIQKIVVQMKDELEQAKEQILNVL